MRSLRPSRGSVPGVRDFLSLLSFLTIIPTGHHDIEAAARAFPYVPLAGLVAGLVAAAPALLGGFFGGILSALAALLVTGLIHADGLFDYADVIGSGLRGEGAVRVLKDPHIGGKGAAFGVLTLMASFSAVIALTLDGLGFPAAVGSAVASYEAMYVVASFGRPAPYGGLGSLFIRLGGGRWFLNSATSLASLSLVVLVGGPVLAIASFSAAVLAAAVIAGDAVRRLGFVSGDVMGFALEVCRAVSLLVILGCAESCSLIA